MLKWLLTMFLIALPVAAAPRLNLALPHTSGMASWYGKREQGRRMANGRPFNRNEYTCASRTYPLGTYLRVTAGRQTVYVRVTDRGPWVKGRVLDLSERAAETLCIRNRGTAHVEIDPVRATLYVRQR